MSNANDKPKPQPERTCIACGVKRSQLELMRVALLRVALQDGSTWSTPVVELGRKSSGRGAYVCIDLSCVDRALKRKAFERALKVKSIEPVGLRTTLEEVVKAKS